MKKLNKIKHLANSLHNTKDARHLKGIRLVDLENMTPSYDNRSYSRKDGSLLWL